MSESGRTDARSLLLVRPEEGARRVALVSVSEADSAAARLSAGSDEEALHDLRVALRRLRSTLRAHRVALRGAIPRRRKQKLRELVAFTSSGRDAEVQLAWLASVEATLPATARAGVERWREHLRRDEGVVYRALRGGKLGELVALLGKLRRDLEEYDLRVRVFEEASSAPRFGDLVADAASSALSELLSLLELVRGVEDEARAHEARIAGKRLRYILEPVRAEVAECKGALDRLKDLQDTLGELQDLAVRTAGLARVIEDAALERARALVDRVVGVEGGADAGADLEVEQGLLALLEVARGRKQGLWTDLLEKKLTKSALEDLETAVRSAVRAIRQATRSGAPREIERKFLLRAVPPELRSRPYKRIAQGYVPGEAIVERVRRISGASGTRYVRTVKLGSGVERIEVEERISRALFTSLWALTEGRRVLKRRYAVPDGGHVWEIDVFTDRPLVLAEVELASVDERPSIPSWLEPYVEREVTDEPEFLNVRLAR